MNDLKKLIRTIPHFPKEGVMFRDITSLLQDAHGLRRLIVLLTERYQDLNLTKICAIESRGFIFGSVLAEKLSAGLVLVRKPGKLPAETISQSYTLEYGEDKLEIHKDSIKPGDRVLVHDDLLATGGTARAACELIEKAGGKIVQVSFIIELSFLGGREKFADYLVSTLVSYDSE